MKGSTLIWKSVLILMCIVCLWQMILINQSHQYIEHNINKGGKDQNLQRSFRSSIINSVEDIKHNNNNNNNNNNKVNIESLHDKYHRDHNHNLFQSNITKSTIRVAIIVVYVGNSFPAWFDIWAMSAGSSSSLIDWLIITTETPFKEVPSNIKLIRITREELILRFLKIDLRLNSTNVIKEKEEIFHQLFEKFPYVLVEFKPALGVVFEDFLLHYSHWAYADLDTLMGRMDSLITIDILTKFDIYTTHFGDAYRVYMRGQLTIHKNDPYINNLWRSCEYLSLLGDRLDSYVASDYKKWPFQSAEGCYSNVVVNHKNVSIMVGANQISDAFKDITTEKEFIMLGSSILRCYKKSFDTSSTNIYKIKEFLKNSPIIKVLDSTRIDNIASSTNLVTVHRKKYRCEYWISPEFEVCLSNIPPHVDLIIENGVYQYIDLDRYNVLDTCREGIIGHFQGWKHNYYVFLSRPPSLDTHAVVISDIGMIPLRIATLDGYSYSDIYDQSLPLGRLSNKDIEFSLITGHDKLAKGRGWNLPRLMGIRNDNNKYDHDGLATQYCASFDADLTKCTCPLLGSHIEIIQVYPDIDSNITISLNSSVTLISVAWADEFYAGLLNSMLDSWPGPKILVLARMDAELDLHTISPRTDVTVIEVDLASCMDNINEVSPEAPVLLDNLLFNIGIDASSTELICISPGGLEFDRDYISNVANEMIKASKQLNNQPSALILPVYSPKSTLTEREKVEIEEYDIEQYGEDEAKLRFYDPVSYPPRGSFCGDQQSNHLIKPYRDAKLYESRHKNNNNKPNSQLSLHPLVRVESHSHDLLKERSLLLPVIFNVTASPHGKDFVRLPEEMSGIGCYGASIYRILTGSGYILLWAPTLVYEAESDNTASEAHASQSSCGCAHGGDDPNILKKMVSRIHSYYLRAFEIRDKNLDRIHTNEKFGSNDEKEQERLFEKKQKKFGFD